MATNNDQVVFAIQNPTLEKAQNGLGVSDGPMYTLESSRPHGVAFPLDSQNGLGRGPDHSTVGVGEDGDPSFTLGRNHHHGVVSFTQEITPEFSEEAVPSLTSGGQRRVSDTHAALRPRRLTTEECEKLQAFPVGYTNIPWKKGMAPDGSRYKALGNSMCVNVMRWIGKRIQLVEEE